MALSYTYLNKKTPNNNLKTSILHTASNIIAVIVFYIATSVSAPINSTAQTSNTLPANSKESVGKVSAQAKELYRSKLYTKAMERFNHLIELGDVPGNPYDIDIEEAQGYRVLCLIMLHKPGTDGLITAYQTKWPYSPLIGMIKFRQAVKYFDNGDFAKAGELLDAIDKRALSKDERSEYNFRKGYCRMRTGNTSGAINTFKSIIQEGNGAYLYPSLYYCGYLHYAAKDFESAIPLFERAKNDSRFALLSRYHILESKFMLKDYGYVTQNGPKLYEETAQENKAKTARIISEAYYAVNDTEKAKYYFELYSLSGTNLSRRDNFYAGMIAYTLGNHISATDAFLKVATTADSIGQNAAYHMGQSYIQLKNKYAAQKAFKMASESDFDKSIQEDAFFNYAKLSFDINRDTEPFNEYINSYSCSNTKWDEIHNYIATEYLIGSNYADAITALKKIKNPSAATTVNLQKASFFRAMQLIRNGSYTNALPYLEESVKNGGYNNRLKNLAEFWIAECHYRKDNFDKSIQIIESLQKSGAFRQSAEYPVSVYNLAYNKFKKGMYEEAVELFGNYTNTEPKPQIYENEAYIRIADSYFMLKEYRQAAELYEQVSTKDNYRDLYAPLQSAISYGLINENTKKKALLYEITGEQHKDSPLYSQALYELGRTLVQSVEDEKAEETLYKLINSPKDSTYYYKALLEMGMIKANKQKFNEALGYYKTIVQQNPVSQEGQSALAGIENIYQIQNKPEEFLAYLESIGLSSIKSADEKETMLFNSAEQIFLGGDYQGALNALTQFLAKYPDGAKSTHANFYIAECYNNLHKYEKAAAHYYKVMERGEGAFSEIATLNYGRLSYRLEKYDEAVKAYETLYKIAQLGNNRTEALIGKISSYFMCKNYSRSIIEADKLLASENRDNSNKEFAMYYKAKSHIALGEREKAIPLLTELAGKPIEEKGAEAAYLLISDAYDSGDFESVEKQTFALSDSNTPQAYWLAKSFIILGDSYAERGNFEQAEATFNSIKENYSPEKEDDIADLLKMRLNKIAKMKQ